MGCGGSTSNDVDDHAVDADDCNKIKTAFS